MAKHMKIEAHKGGKKRKGGKRKAHKGTKKHTVVKA